jgi:hypothetical protein
MRSLLARALPCWLLSLAGCVSGQTGSPDCVGPTSCVCDPLYGAGSLLHVHVESAPDGKLQAVIDEIFPSELDRNPLRVGDRIGGTLSLNEPCSSQAPPDLAAGDEALVLFTPGTNGDYPNCAAFQACAAQQCANLAQPALNDCWQTCETQTRTSCDTAREAALSDGYYAWVLRWKDPLSFGASHELPLAELSVLSSTQSCLERFPADPLPPCQDTRSLTCAAGGSGAHAPGGALSWLGLAVSALGVWRWRSARRSRLAC